MTSYASGPAEEGRSETATLRGYTALVTGATRGIGHATARTLAEAGAQVHLLARSEIVLRRLVSELGGDAWPADLEDEASVWDALDRLQEKLGGAPDIVVNAAGVFDVAPLAETSVEVFDRNVMVNLRGTFLVLRAVLPDMIGRGSGLLVNVGSVAGRKAFPGNGAYSASKWGLQGMHEVLLEELRGSGVRACLVEPAATDTSIWDPLSPDETDDLPDRSEMLRPETVADAVLYLATRPDEVRIPYFPIERS